MKNDKPDIRLAFIAQGLTPERLLVTLDQAPPSDYTVGHQDDALCWVPYRSLFGNCDPVTAIRLAASPARGGSRLDISITLESWVVSVMPISYVAVVLSVAAMFVLNFPVRCGPEWLPTMLLFIGGTGFGVATWYQVFLHGVQEGLRAHLQLAVSNLGGISCTQVWKPMFSERSWYHWLYLVIVTVSIASTLWLTMRASWPIGLWMPTACTAWGGFLFYGLRNGSPVQFMLITKAGPRVVCLALVGLWMALPIYANPHEAGDSIVTGVVVVSLIAPLIMTTYLRMVLRRGTADSDLRAAEGGRRRRPGVAMAAYCVLVMCLWLTLWVGIIVGLASIAGAERVGAVVVEGRLSGVSVVGLLSLLFRGSLKSCGN